MTSTSTSPLRRIGATLCVLLAGCIAFANSFDGAFVFDDLHQIVGNDELHVLWPPTTAVGLSFRPFVYYSFAINHAISGHDVWSYHAVNLALHLLTALTLLALVRRLLMLPRVAFERRDAERVALAITLLWVVHPLHTQSVVYIIQRFEVMMGLAYLLTLYSFVRAVDPASERTRGRWYVAVVLSFFVGLGCKEVIATAPVALLLLDAVVVTGSFRSAMRRRWALYVALVAPFALAPIWWLITNPERFVLLRPDSDSPPALTYVLTQGRVIVEYLRLAAWPVGQNLDHAWFPEDHGATRLPAFALLAALFAVTVVGLWRGVAAAWLSAMFFLTLAVTSSFFPLEDYMAEHRMYLALIPVIAAVVLGGRAALHRLVIDGRTRAVVAALLVATTALAATSMTIRRNPDYSSRVRMWTDVIDKAPHNSRAYYNLGVALLDEDVAANADRALQLFERTIELNPSHAAAHTNAGSILASRSEHMAAARHYRTAMAVARKHTYEMLHGYGHTLLSLDRPADARVVFKRGIDRLRRGPQRAARRAVLNHAMGLCSERLGDSQAAIGHFHRALKRDPTLAVAHVDLVRVLVAADRHAEAIDRCIAECAREPSSFEHRVRLARVYAAAARVEPAIDAYLAALSLRPESLDTRVELRHLCVAAPNRNSAAAHLDSLAEREPADDNVTELIALLREM